MNKANVKLVGNAKRDAAIKAAHERMLATRYGINSSEYRRITSKR
jgi:hypothetical protein